MQHLGAHFESQLSTFIAKVTDIPIRIPKQGEQLQKNCIYLQPKGHTLRLSNERFHLEPIVKSDAPQYPINGLFRSACKLHNRRICAVILSGTGSDGASSLKELQAASALILAQSPETAEFSGMPLSAIETNAVDFALPANQMGQKIQQFLDRDPESTSTQPTESSPLDQLFEKLLERTGVDFKHYKMPTLTRRLDRRMGINGIDTLQRYVDLAVSNTAEADLLYQDLLIGVTSFFRDKHSFSALREQILNKLANEWASKKHLRVWVSCCSTGQEVYSVAIMLLELIEQSALPIKVKVFATDADPTAVRIASEGHYSHPELAEVDPELLKRYFVPTDKGYRVSEFIRKHVVFAHHNLLRDPPFSHIDLVTCRNMMIYLERSAQVQVLSSLHFALTADGLIMLGRSESPRELSRGFKSLDEKAKIFETIPNERLPLIKFQPPLKQQFRKREKTLVSRENDDQKIVKNLALHFFGKFTPPSIVVDDADDIRHVFGDISAYTQPIKPGRFSAKMAALIHDDLSVAVYTALKRSREENKEINYRNVVMSNAGLNVHIAVLPFKDRAGTNSLSLICFEPADQPENTQDRQSAVDFDEIELSRERIKHLEAEVMRQSESLQATVEELETTNEELQSSNEELMVANEELQSANEELQSVNEELYSVNAEYEEKIEELSKTQSSLEQIIQATSIGLLMVNHENMVVSFTENVTQYVKLKDSDVGRPLSDLSQAIDYPELIDDVKSVLKEKEAVEHLARGTKGSKILVRISPLTDIEPSGAVLTFTPLKAE